MNNTECNIDFVTIDGHDIYSPSKPYIYTALSRDGLQISNLSEPTEMMKLIAVRQNGLAIDYIENPSQELIITALMQNGLSLEFIDNVTELDQCIAVISNPIAINLIDNPSTLVCSLSEQSTLDQRLYMFIKNIEVLFDDDEIDDIQHQKIKILSKFLSGYNYNGEMIDLYDYIMNRIG